MQINSGVKNFIAAILTIAMGVLLIVKQADLLGIVFTIAGVLLITLGVIDLFSKTEGVIALLKVAAGVLLIVGGWAFVEIIQIIFGVLLILWAVKKLINDKNKSIIDWIIIILTVALGIMIIVGSIKIFEWMFIALGILVILYGIGMLFGKQPKKRKRQR